MLGTDVRNMPAFRRRATAALPMGTAACKLLVGNHLRVIQRIKQRNSLATPLNVDRNEDFRVGGEKEFRQVAKLCKGLLDLKFMCFSLGGRQYQKQRK